LRHTANCHQALILEDEEKRLNPGPPLMLIDPTLFIDREMTFLKNVASVIARPELLS